jgi:tripartite-type tricarboxylate transporter receptor subunit TctC
MMRFSRRTILKVGAGSALAGTLPAQWSAQGQEAYPRRPIRVVITHPPGGALDAIPRAVVQNIGAGQGWTTVMDNRPGASGELAIIHAKQAKPDGYTLVTINGVTHGTAPAIKPDLGYDPIKDLTPIILLADAPLVLLVNSDVPASTLSEFIALLRKQPGKLNYGSGGFGSQHHLAGVMLVKRVGLPQSAATHVPYKGQALAVTDLLAGHIQFMISTTGPALPHIASGKLRALAVTGRQRSPRLPDVPIMAEVGMKDFEVTAWSGLAAPVGTPAPILARWNKLANAALSDGEVKKQLAVFDFDPRGGTATEFIDFIAQEVTGYKQLAGDAGLVK